MNRAVTHPSVKEYSAYAVAWIIALLLSITLFLLPSPMLPLLYADIVTDGSVGPAQALVGPDFAIPQKLGTVSGNNLFHSFHTFSISETQSATFTGDHGIVNVISRVTGGEISSIDGMLRSTVEGADFFFINPSGILFGPHARVDVPAAFHAGTAEELIFEDGSVLKTSSPEISTLTQAQPESFGFIGAKPATIEVNGSVLKFVPESTVSLSGGNITIHPSKTAPSPALVCENGKIAIAATGSAEMLLPVLGKVVEESHVLGNATTGTGIGLTEKGVGKNEPLGHGVMERDVPESAQGELIIESAEVNASGNGSGYITVQAGNAKLVNARVKLDNIYGENLDSSDTHPQGHAGTVEINVSDLLELSSGARISSDTFSQGNGGDIQVTAGNITMNDGGKEEQLTGIWSNANYLSQGDAGNVDITVPGRLEIINGARITTETFSLGDAGTIKIAAQDLMIDNYENINQWTGVWSESNLISQGDSGTVEITLSGLLEILNGAWISSTTYSLLGNAGSITITAPRIELMKGSAIVSSTFSHGDAGSIKITADDLTLDGQGDVVDISSGSLGEGFEGDAGTIEITVSGLLNLKGGGAISTDTWSKGSAGKISIYAEDIKINGQGDVAGIVSNAYEGSLGDAGTIEITVSGLLNLKDGGEIFTVTQSEGNAGSISIDAENITMDGHGSFVGVASSTLTHGSQGDAGVIEIRVSNLLEMMNGGGVVSDTWSNGDAGNISIAAENITIDGQGRFAGISSDAYEGSLGNAGIIEVTASGLLDMKGRGLISSNTWSRGDAGNIKINASRFAIDSSKILSAASDTSTGDVGRIEINSRCVELSKGAEISAAAHQTVPEDQFDDLYADKDRLDSFDINKSIFLDTVELTLDENSKITSESTGNVPASDIDIKAENITVKESSSITTSADKADGGDISIQGRNIFLSNGLITTSVNDINGDGGDITFQGMVEDESADYLIMDHGFIQANSAAKNARGGNINLDINGIIVDKNQSLTIEDPQRRDFEKDPLVNVIQAAAPGGTKGDVNISQAPELDISGVIVNMNTQLSRQVGLATDPCLMLNSGSAISSLIKGTKGGLPEWPESPSTIFFDSKLLKGFSSKKP